jgi:hypothetical protein
MKVVDIANEIYLENASPSDTGLAAIAFWVRSNVGRLNTLLYEDFYVDENTYEIFKGDRNNPCRIHPLAVAIVKTMYKLYRAELDIRALLTTLQTDTILEASDEGFTVKKVNRSEILKTLTALKKDAMKELTDMVHYYRSYHAEPSQVAGNDTVPGRFPPYDNAIAFQRWYY